MNTDNRCNAMIRGWSPGGNAYLHRCDLQADHDGRHRAGAISTGRAEYRLSDTPAEAAWS